MHCRQGFVNRIGIFECLALDETNKKNILLKKSLDTLALPTAFTLQKSFAARIKEKITSQTEFMRLMGEDYHD